MRFSGDGRPPSAWRTCLPLASPLVLFSHFQADRSPFGEWQRLSTTVCRITSKFPAQAAGRGRPARRSPFSANALRYNREMVADQITAIARRHGIRLMVQFGSSVTGRTHAQSDVDIAVLLERFPSTLDANIDLETDIQGLFPGHTLDLAIVNRADPLFLKQITNHCALLFGAERDLHLLKIYAFKRFQDHRRYLAMERAYVTQAIRTLEA